MLGRIRSWAKTHTSRRRYSPVGIGFHWGMALLIAGMLLLGWIMGRIDAGGAKAAAFQLHMAIGLVTLFLSGLRLVWRVLIPGPVNDADGLGFQTTLANITHGAFYLCFIGLPVTGWLSWSAFAGSSNLNLGIVAVPPFPFEVLSFTQKAQVLYWADAGHHLLIWLLLLVIPAHVVAALKHHFWDRHDVLVGMLPVLAGDEAAARPKHRRKAPRSRPRSKTG